MNNYFEKFKELKVLVIGDVMIDKYLYCDVERISPEAPVPVARFKKEENKLGGAANVALNLASLGVSTTLFGACGEDINKDIIKNICNNSNISFKPLIEKDMHTISKIRIVSKHSQVLRLDYEEKDFIIDSLKVISKLELIIKDFDIVIVSDYQKGLLSQRVINYLGTTNKYISIDTKPGSFRSFNNFSLIKPNFSEALGIAKSFGLEGKFSNTNLDCEKICEFIFSKLNTPILVTRSEMGATYFDGESFYHSKTQVSEVIDVTGAGDTCISIFSLLDYLGIEKKEALHLMNAAAKVAVSHFSTYAPSINEIKSELYSEDFENVISFEKVSDLSQKLKLDGKKIVFTNGCFDLLHKGHVSYLNEAKTLGDILIVGINSDNSVKKLKGDSSPIIDEASRAFVLSNLKSVDYVCIFNEDNPIDLIKKIKPDIHVKGGDYSELELIETPHVKEFGGKVKILNFINGYSTTNIKNKIKNNDG